MSHPVIIEQTQPPGLSLVLHGPALPEVQLPEHWRLGYIKQYYPGAKNPTFQILNAETRPITIRGLFSDLETATPGFANAMRTLARRIFHDAVPVALLYRCRLAGLDQVSTRIVGAVLRRLGVRL